MKRSNSFVSKLSKNDCFLKGGGGHLRVNSKHTYIFRITLIIFCETEKELLIFCLVPPPSLRQSFKSNLSKQKLHPKNLQNSIPQSISQPLYADKFVTPCRVYVKIFQN